MRSSSGFHTNDICIQLYPRPSYNRLMFGLGYRLQVLGWL